MARDCKPLLFKNPRRPDGATTRYGYDSELQLTSVTNPLGEHWIYRYNATGHLIALTNVLDEVTTFKRDQLGRLIEKIAPGGSSRFEYGALGRLTQAHSPGAEWPFGLEAATAAAASVGGWLGYEAIKDGN